MTSESLTTNLIENFSVDNLQSFFRQKLSSFRPEKEDYSHLFEDKTEEKYTAIYKLGQANLKDSTDELLVVSAQTQSNLTYKTGKRQQFEMAKKVLQYENKDAAFFIFYDEEKNFRFSFVKANFEGKTKKYTNFKRYTYFVSKEQSNRTFIEQTEKAEFSDIDSIIEAFSIEPLNKQFYKDISAAFDELTGIAQPKNKTSKNTETSLFTPLQLPSITKQQATKTSKEFAVRLIGRIIFVWFLKNKVSKNGTPLVPTDWLNSQKAEQTDSYYHFFLEKLFFQVLNKPLDERIDNILENHQKIPFLNGGLFEAQEEDYYNADKNGLSTNLNTLIIPNSWIKDFFQTLERYNFTIDENSLSDQEVSIDPEMLGTIFENLLAEINPETEQSARKETGSFYTPRSIVDYMIEESLVAYLTNATPTPPDSLRLLFQENDLGEADFYDYKEQIIDAFLNVRILDPACGSGAYPIGALQKINFALQKIDPEAEIFKKKFVAGIPSGRMRRKMKEELDKSTVDYVRKFGIIQKSIFGVDIQSIATEISKLRCFLTLIVDEAVEDTDQNRGIKPLPNLEFKFVTANTLIDIPSPFPKYQEPTNLIELREEFAELTQEYFDAENHTHKIDLKRELSQIVEKICTQQRSYLDMNVKNLQKQINSATKAKIKSLNENIEVFSNAQNQWDSFKNIFKNKTVEFFNSSYFFPDVKEGFDIVIGNPPYVQIQKLKSKQKDFENQNYKTYQRTGDIYCLFYERAIDLLKQDGILCFITSNKWMRAGYGESMRNYFIEKTNPLQLIDFGGVQIFDNATVDTNILITQKAENQNQLKGCLIDKTSYNKSSNISTFFRQNALKLNPKNGWVVMSEMAQQIKTKIEKIGTPLKDWDIQINYGIKTGYNEAFIIDKAKKDELIAKSPNSAEVIRPILRGRDIKKYSYEFAELYLIGIKMGWTNKNKGTENAEEFFKKTYSSIYEHFKIMGNAKSSKGKGLYNRTDKGDYWWELRSCVYWEDFQKEKILWAEMTNENCFCWENGNIMANQTCYFIPNSSKSLLSILNSKLIYFYFSCIATGLGDGAFRWIKQFVEKIPIAEIEEKKQKGFNAIVDKIIELKSKNEDTKHLENQIDNKVFELYNLTKEEIEFIENF